MLLCYSKVKFSAHICKQQQHALNTQLHMRCYLEHLLWSVAIPPWTLPRCHLKYFLCMALLIAILRNRRFHFLHFMAKELNNRKFRKITDLYTRITGNKNFTPKQSSSSAWQASLYTVIIWSVAQQWTYRLIALCSILEHMVWVSVALLPIHLF